MFNFIASCLKAEEERKGAEELLQSKYFLMIYFLFRSLFQEFNIITILKLSFLNDLEGEENSNPVKLVDSIFSYTSPAHHFPNGINGDISKNKSKLCIMIIIFVY